MSHLHLMFNNELETLSEVCVKPSRIIQQRYEAYCREPTPLILRRPSTLAEVSAFMAKAPMEVILMDIQKLSDILKKSRRIQGRYRRTVLNALERIRVAVNMVAGFTGDKRRQELEKIAYQNAISLLRMEYENLCGYLRMKLRPN